MLPMVLTDKSPSLDVWWRALSIVTIVLPQQATLFLPTHNQIILRVAQGRLRGDLPPGIPHNRSTHSALYITDHYVVANELTHCPAISAAKCQGDATAFFRQACGIKTDDD